MNSGIGMAVDPGLWRNWRTPFVLNLRPHRNHYGTHRTGKEWISTCRRRTEGQVGKTKNILYWMNYTNLLTGYHLWLGSDIFYDVFSTILKSPRVWVTKSGTMGEGLGPVISSSVVIPNWRGKSMYTWGVETMHEPVRTSRVVRPPFLPNKISVFNLSPTIIVRLGSKCTLTGKRFKFVSKISKDNFNNELGFDTVQHGSGRFPRTDGIPTQCIS